MINHTIYDAHNKNKSANGINLENYKLKCVQGQIASKSTTSKTQNVLYRKSSEHIVNSS